MCYDSLPLCSQEPWSTKKLSVRTTHQSMISGRDLIHNLIPNRFQPPLGLRLVLALVKPTPPLLLLHLVRKGGCMKLKSWAGVWNLSGTGASCTGQGKVEEHQPISRNRVREREHVKVGRFRSVGSGKLVEVIIAHHDVSSHQLQPLVSLDCVKFQASRSSDQKCCVPNLSSFH